MRITLAIVCGILTACSVMDPVEPEARCKMRRVNDSTFCRCDTLIVMSSDVTDTSDHGRITVILYGDTLYKDEW